MHLFIYRIRIAFETGYILTALSSRLIIGKEILISLSSPTKIKFFVQRQEELLIYELFTRSVFGWINRRVKLKKNSLIFLTWFDDLSGQCSTGSESKSLKNKKLSEKKKRKERFINKKTKDESRLEGTHIYRRWKRRFSRIRYAETQEENVCINIWSVMLWILTACCIRSTASEEFLQSSFPSSRISRSRNIFVGRKSWKYAQNAKQLKSSRDESSDYFWLILV